MIESDANLPVVSPEVPAAEEFRDPKAAVDRLNTLYKIAVDFLTETFSSHVVGARPDTRFRAFYPEIRFRTATFAQTDSRLSFGHVPGPGTYATTITRPDLFEGYLEQQIALLIENHDEPVVIGVSDTAMPCILPFQAKWLFRRKGLCNSPCVMCLMCRIWRRQMTISSMASMF